MSYCDLHEAFEFPSESAMNDMARSYGQDEPVEEALGWRLATLPEFKQFVHARFGRLFSQAVIEMEFEHYCKFGVNIHDYLDFMDNKR